MSTRYYIVPAAFAAAVEQEPHLLHFVDTSEAVALGTWRGSVQGYLVRLTGVRVPEPVEPWRGEVPGDPEQLAGGLRRCSLVLFDEYGVRAEVGELDWEDPL